jgi:predicted phage terminase large subunit-like protein
MLDTARRDRQRYGNTVHVWTVQDPGSAGKEVAQDKGKMLAGFPVHAERVTGDEAVRAEPFAAQAEAGNVRLVRGPWNAAYVDELTAFPNGAFDDQVDGSSGAFNKLTRTPAPSTSGPSVYHARGTPGQPPYPYGKYGS